ncbi:MAG: hypothetical protein B9S32_04215 [Verrucomicrobia bacterium Tous-C9LFEB]|nr:MAG: hypothetical protein B9S32_04215 [Verrucomicrobia bacterium Tous-C9LFEB]
MISYNFLYGVELQFEERFTLIGRSAGRALDKTEMDNGKATWEATQNVLVDSQKNEGALIAVDKKPFAGRILIPAGTKKITVKATLRPEQAVGEKSWVAIGIGNPKLGIPVWGQGIFLYATTDGRFGLAGDPDPEDMMAKELVMIKSGPIPEYEKGETVKVRLEYDVDIKTVSAWINEAQICDNLNVSTKKFVVDPAFAGFSGYNQKVEISPIEKIQILISQ